MIIILIVSMQSILLAYIIIPHILLKIVVSHIFLTTQSSAACWPGLPGPVLFYQSILLATLGGNPYTNSWLKNNNPDDGNNK